MFSFKSLHKGSRTASSTIGRLMAQSAVALFALFVFSGCPNETEPDAFVDDHVINPSLVETWKDIGPYGGDIYTINGTTLVYEASIDNSMSYSGTIRYVSNFSSSKSAGVIIIEYEDGHKPTYKKYDESWNEIGTYTLKGDFIGIYYKELKPGVSVQMGQAYGTGGVEEDTLAKAKEVFTVGNEGKYMTYYGTYTKQ